MRELVVENQEILIIPQNFKDACKGNVTEVRAGDFTLLLDREPEGIMKDVYCEFYTQTSRGKLHFDSYVKQIDGKSLIIASPAKHKFLQRRQYTRVKYFKNLELTNENGSVKITTADISAGGMKLKTTDKLDIDGVYNVELPLSENIVLACKYSPIRIEKNNDNSYTISGRFSYESSASRMVLLQYCAKRSVEIKNK